MQFIAFFKKSQRQLRMNFFFQCKGRQTSFAEYYLTRYKLKLSDQKQPLLVSMPTARDKRFAAQRGHQAQPCKLIPE